jgi:hypothetical protein
MNTSDSLNPIRIERISEEEFAGMRDAWNAALAGSVTNEVYLSWEWMHSWWEVFRNGSMTLVILLGRDARDEIVGIAPFYVEQGRKFGFIGTHTLRLCSSRETYPDHLDLIMAKGQERAFPEAVLAYLKEHEDEWDLIRLDGIEENAVIKKHLTGPENGSSRAYLVDALPDSECPYLPIRDSYGDLIRSFSRNKRNNLLRKRKSLLEKESCRYGIAEAEGDDPVRHFRELFALHGERARRKGIRSDFTGEKVLAFHEKFIERSTGARKPVIAYIAEGTEFLVLHYCIRHNNKYYIYQTGISQEGENRSAGAVLLSVLIERAFQEKSSEFDFSRGKQDYKYYWTDSARRNYSLVVRKHTLGNTVVHQLSGKVVRPGRRILKHAALGLLSFGSRWIADPLVRWYHAARDRRSDQAEAGQPDEPRAVEAAQTEGAPLPGTGPARDLRPPAGAASGAGPVPGPDDGPIAREEVERLIAERTLARQDRQWKRADEIRLQLARRGVVIRDTPQGTVWEYEGAAAATTTAG